MDPLVSVIVPVYNVEKYIDKCLSSISKQRYSNLEIILVNDGSTDTSELKCQKWAKMDSRIKVLSKANGGVSSARNFGIDSSTGQYLFFVDSDDWLPTNAIDTLVSKVKDTNIDFIFGQAEGIGVFRKEYYGVNQNIVASKDDETVFAEYTQILRTALGPWAKLYDSEIIKNNNLFFPEGVLYGEDRIFIWTYLKYCSKVACTSDVVYYYSQLNLTRACGKYYPNANKWLKMAADLYCDLFRDVNQLNYQMIYNVIMQQCRACCEHYYKYTNGTEQEVIQKIDETIQLFQCTIDRIDLKRTLSTHNTISVEDKRFARYVVSGDSNGIYSLFAKTIPKESGALKIELRNIFVKVKRCFIYKML